MRRFDQRIGRFVFAAVVAGFALIAVAVVSVGLLLQRVQENSSLVSHTYEVEAALSVLQAGIERVETARRGYLLEPNERFIKAFTTSSGEVPDKTQRLIDLVSDNPEQQQRAMALTSLQDDFLSLLRASIENRQNGGPGYDARNLLDDPSFQLIREIRRGSDAMLQAERELLGHRVGRLRRSTRLTYGVMTAAGMLLALVAGGTIWATRRNVRALSATGARLAELNEDLEAAVAVRTAELTRANDEIQRFAYIVSHDLRSPLVNVMGFTSELDAATKPLAELIRRAEVDAPQLVTEDARLAVETDLPEAIGFIRSSTQKMDRLINAILRLSREGRRVLTPERLDMNALVAGIVDSLHHRLQETGAEIAVEKLPAIISDRVAIEQVFSNLIENSVKYLKPGRPGRIVVRAHRRAPRVVFEVEDNGRGIDPKDRDRIFDLFRRSGAQDQPGEGIGLAHVRALAYRLGGVIECDSKLDVGATFRLSIPVESSST